MEQAGFNIVDLSVLGVLLVSGVLAFMRGLVREVFALGAWVGASLAAVFLYPVAKPWVHQHIKSELAADAATAVGLFCLALVILIPLGSFLSGLVKGQALTAIDRSLGFVFGLVRGLLVLSLMYLVVMWVWPDKDKPPEWLAHAKTQPVLAFGADILKDLIPKDKQEKMADEVNKKRTAAEEAAAAAQQLQKLATPIPASKDNKSPSYGDDSRTKLDALIEQQGKH